MSTNPNYTDSITNPDLGHYNLIDDAVLNGHNNYYNFNEHTLEFLFFNPLYEPIRGKNFDGPDNRSYWLKDDYTYRVNKYAFRSSEFCSDQDFVFAGCSHTYGMGIPEEMIWGVQLANKLGKDYANLAIPGASVTTIVNNLFAYFRLFGHPKTIVVLFPNFERLMLPVNPAILTPQDKKYDSQPRPLNDRYLDHSYLMEKIHPKFSKKPHIVEEVVPLDVPYWMATQSINLLEQYCDTANIKLIWSTWDFHTQKSLKKMNEKDNSYFKYIVDIKMQNWVAIDPKGPDLYHNSQVLKDDLCLDKKGCNLTINCHKDIELQHPKIFDLAADNAHWGTHRHTHVAEEFYKHVKDKV